jgi:acyl carrier protein phosphodiesterase
LNHLAHTFLSCKDPELLAGNFMADFITKADLKTLDPSILKGIELHKKIDKFTDEHQMVRQAVRLLHPTQHKYAPVTLDILFDYYLTKNWEKYAGENIDTFTQRIYQMLEQKRDVYPLKLRELLPKMIDDDFLMSCKNEERLIKTFERIGRRAKFTHSFHTAHIDMQQHYDVLDNHFNIFFPDIMFHVNDFCDCN